MSSTGDRLVLGSLSGPYWLAVGLSGVTGVIHLVLGLSAPTSPVGAASVLAAFGYAGAVGLVLSGYRQRVVAAAGVPYVVSQIGLWYALNRPASLADISPAAIVDKSVQVVLVGVCLWILFDER